MCWAGLIDGWIIVHWFDEKSKTEHRSTAQMVRDWLASKFGDQATRLTDPGPPDLLTSLPLDFWFWDVCEVKLMRHPPSSMAELRATINSLAEWMSLAEMRKAINNMSKRAEACITVSGDNFEHLLKKAKRDIED